MGAQDHSQLWLAHAHAVVHTLANTMNSCAQDHYDFGMRALKSVLVMAGTLKRSNPDLSEDIVLIRAIRDSNIPKFLSEVRVFVRTRVCLLCVSAAVCVCCCLCVCLLCVSAAVCVCALFVYARACTSVCVCARGGVSDACLAPAVVL